MSKNLELWLVNGQVEAHLDLLGIVFIHVYEVERLKTVLGLSVTFSFAHCFLR